MPDARDSLGSDPRFGRSAGSRACKLLVLGAWVVGANGLVAYLMAQHEMPLPAGNLGQQSAIRQSAEWRWRAVHVLAAGCPCSAAVAEELIRRGPADGLDETVYVAGGDGDALLGPLAARGFRVTRVTPSEMLTRLSIRGAPWLVLFAPDGHVAYSGGYAPERPRTDVPIQDLAVLRRLRAGESVTPYPAFGCATDRQLQRQLDPLRLKY